MASSPIRVYWDSDLFLRTLNRGSNPSLLATLDAIWVEATAGKIQLVTSTLSMAEVSFTRADLEGVPAFDREADIDAVWDAFPALLLVEYSREVARIARGVKRWQFQAKVVKVGMVDMIHLATAMYAGAVEVQAMETRWQPYTQHLGIPVGLPRTRASPAPQLPLIP